MEHRRRSSLVLVLLAAWISTGMLAGSVVPEGKGQEAIKAWKSNNVKRLSVEEWNRMAQESLDQFRKENPARFESLSRLAPPAEKSVRADQVGDTHTFVVSKIPFGHVEVTAELKAKGAHCQIWVDQAAWAAGYVTQAVVDSILDNLESHTGPYSIDPDQGIYQIDTEYFGLPPNVDGDGMVDFLLTDIQDGFDPPENSGYVAGFFTSLDQSWLAYLTGRGNYRDMLYLDCYPGIYYEGQYDTEFVLSTTAHELQHLIHYHHDDSEYTWLNEAMSQAAIVLTGYSFDLLAFFLAEPNNRIDDWAPISDTTGRVNSDYALVQLWSLYLYEQLGAGLFREIVQNPADGVASVDQVLASRGASFDSVYRDWIVANCVNDRSVDPRWGYSHPCARNLRANPRETHSSYPIQIGEHVVEQNAALYFRFTTGQRLQIGWDSPTAFGRLVRRGPAGVAVRDLPTGGMWTDPDFGAGFSEAILVVGNAAADSEVAIVAEADQPWNLAEVGYDDGQPDPFYGIRCWLGAGYGRTGHGWAVRFERPAQADVLEKITLNMYMTWYNQAPEGEVLLHLYEDVNGQPGQDLLPPQPVVLNGFWNEIDVPLLFGTAVAAPSSFFVGITHATALANPQMALSDSYTPNRSWMIHPDQPPVRLDDLVFGDGISLDGFNLILRATLSADRVSPDVNVDGHTDALDLVCLLTCDPDPASLSLAARRGDLDGSGQADAADLVLLAAYLAGNFQ